jgi:hypothetical protein
MALDEIKLKKLVLDTWSAFGPDTLVKVMAAGSTPVAGRAVGYCSTIKFVIGRTPAEMESVLGLRSGTKLSSGAEIFAVFPLPSAEEFDLRGYTHTPEGIPTDVKTPHPDYPPGQGAPQWDLSRVDQQRHLRWIATVPAGTRFSFLAMSLTPERLSKVMR